MHKVFFESLCVYQSPSIEDAVGFALGLHKSSNVPHAIGVIEVGKLKPTIVFRTSVPAVDQNNVSDGN